MLSLKTRNIHGRKRTLSSAVPRCAPPVYLIAGTPKASPIGHRYMRSLDHACSHGTAKPLLRPLPCAICGTLADLLAPTEAIPQPSDFLYQSRMLGILRNYHQARIALIVHKCELAHLACGPLPWIFSSSFVAPCSTSPHTP